MIKFEIVRTRNKQFRARLIARNGKVVFWSETYRRRAGVIKALRLVSTDRPIYDKTRGAWLQVLV